MVVTYHFIVKLLNCVIIYTSACVTFFHEYVCDYLQWSTHCTSVCLYKVFKSIFKAKESVKVHLHPKIFITYSTLVISRLHFIFMLDTNEGIWMKVSNRRLGSTLTSIVGKLNKFWNFQMKGYFLLLLFFFHIPSIYSLLCF